MHLYLRAHLFSRTSRKIRFRNIIFQIIPCKIVVYDRINVRDWLFRCVRMRVEYLL